MNSFMQESMYMKMNPVSALKTIAAILVVLGVAACEEEISEAPERIRAIKSFSIVEAAGGDVRRYSGAIAAADSSALGFAVAGTVKTISVNRGDRVSKGQVLATLDEENFKLDAEASRAEVKAKRAELDQLNADKARQEELYRLGWVAKAALEKITAQQGAAEEGLNLARSRLGIVERDLGKTKLVAPFDGVISERIVDPFAEVKTGEKLFQIDSEDALEVEFSVADSVISRVAVGTPVAISVSTVPGCGCTGRVTEIGVASTTGNAVPVKAAILTSPDGLLPGMSVEASVSLSGEAGTNGLLVPLVAIAPGDENAKGYVFKYSADSGTVNKTAVESGRTINGNFVSIAKGVEIGDIVAAAGVSLLRDGQRVTLMAQ